MIAHRRRPSFRNDQRRKHHHWQVTIFYPDGQKFSRVYTDHTKAKRFAGRQRQSPVVKMARITKIS